MIPVFKSCYSIGKSILTIDKQSTDGGPDSIVDICKENAYEKLVLVEDTMTGFMKANEACKENNLQLIFGLRLTCCNNVSADTNSSDHKIICFAKNDNGCKLLNKFFSFANAENDGAVDFDYLNKSWTDDLSLVIPFYDSFIYNNNTKISNCIPDFNKIKPSFFIERNNLPFDAMIQSLVWKYTDKAKRYPVYLSKSIYYKNKEDYKALQTYKILCNRSFGRVASLSSPNLNHFGSNEFCLESYKEHVNNLYTPL